MKQNDCKILTLAYPADSVCAEILNSGSLRQVINSAGAADI